MKNGFICKFNISLILLILFFVFCSCISCVSAADMHNITTGNFDDLKADVANNRCNEFIINGDFNDLNVNTANITSSSEIILNKDYTIEGDSSIDLVANNIVINGDGHFISACNHTGSIFNVHGSNVVIKNLTVIASNLNNYNSKMNHMKNAEGFYNFNDLGTISWYGDNGVINNCNFKNNCGVNGGAVTLYGNNICINNTKFIDSHALGAGGAVYNTGLNNTVVNSLFLNSTSGLVNEAIFSDRKMNINSTFNTVAYIYNNGTLFDSNNFKNAFIFQMGYSKLNLIPIIYASLRPDFSHMIDKTTSFYSLTNDKKSYSLVLHHDFDDGIFNNDGYKTSYIKEYDITNIDNINDIIHKLEKGEFNIFNSLIHTVYVNDKDTYDKACSYLSKNVFFAWHIDYALEKKTFTKGHSITNIYKALTFNYEKALSELSKKNITTILNVVFTKTLDIKDANTWNLKDSPFTLVNIDGHGSKIYANANKRSEHNFAKVPENKFLHISNITIQSFNRGIYNEGFCFLDNVVLDNNRMDYIKDPDWGAGILNCGYCECNNCSFTNNNAEYGGAIFNLGILVANNCNFTKNHGNGQNILNIKDGNVWINGKNTTSGIVKCRNDLPNPVPDWVETLTTIACYAGVILAPLGLTILGGYIGGGIGAIIGFGIGVGIGITTYILLDKYVSVPNYHGTVDYKVCPGNYFSNSAFNNKEYNFVC